MSAGRGHLAPGEDIVLTPPGLAAVGAPTASDTSRGPAGSAVRLHIVRHGDGAGAPVLLVHGAGTSSRLWRDVQHDLGPDLCSTAPDLLGCGASERLPHHDVGPAGQTAALVALLDHLAWPRCTVVGHGVGGAVAVHLAAHHPDRVAGLVLVDAALHSQVWPPRAVRPLVAPGGDLLVSGIRRSRRTALAVLARACGADRLTDPVLDELVRPLLSRDGAHALVAFLRAVDMAQVEQAWRLLKVAPPPALVLWGETDPVVPLGYGWRLANELPAAAWVPVDSAGHLLPLERPERVAEEVAAFAGALAALPPGQQPGP